MVLSRIAVRHCGLSGPQQPGTRTLIHVFSLLSQLSHSIEAVFDPFSYGAFGPLAFADWPHHRLRILSRRCFLSFCRALSCRRRWFEHHPRSTSLLRAYLWPSGGLEHSEPEPTRCSWPLRSHPCNSAAFSTICVDSHQSSRAMVAHAVTGTQ